MVGSLGCCPLSLGYNARHASKTALPALKGTLAYFNISRNEQELPSKEIKTTRSSTQMVFRNCRMRGLLKCKLAKGRDSLYFIRGLLETVYHWGWVGVMFLLLPKGRGAGSLRRREDCRLSEATGKGCCAPSPLCTLLAQTCICWHICAPRTLETGGKVFPNQKG